MNVAVFHPDLGIGGAGRLAVDAAVALKRSGHRQVTLVTSYANPIAYPETSDDGHPDHVRVTVAGDWFPRTLFGGRFVSACSLARTVLAALHVVSLRPDAILCDMSAYCVPIFKALSSARVVFYCHFPNKMKVAPVTFSLSGWVEERSTAMADAVLVNSEFTLSAFKEAFPSIKAFPRLVYPSVDANRCALCRRVRGQDENENRDERTTFLSINRYKRKKNHSLAIEAFGNISFILRYCTRIG